MLSGKTAVFIDGANFSHTAKRLNMQIDYKKMLASLKENTELIRTFYYTAMYTENDGNIPMQRLVDYLSYNGYTVVTKPAKVFTDINEVVRIKGNMDIEIAVDMLKIAKCVDNITLFSGDGDFCPLVKAVQEQGVFVTVVSSFETRPSMIADELRRQADEFIGLETLRNYLT